MSIGCNPSSCMLLQRQKYKRISPGMKDTFPMEGGGAGHAESDCITNLVHYLLSGLNGLRRRR